jgi:folate-binding Fe-S cluster repair protein YgfZ
MIIDLNNYYSILTVKGDDAATFLQGQITNDIHRADQGMIYSGICNPKGDYLHF